MARITILLAKTSLEYNNLPVFGTVPSGLNIDENVDGTTTAVDITTVSATDADAEDTVSFSITGAIDQGGNAVTGFMIDATTGAITYNGTGLDAEAVNTVTLTVTATDSRQGSAQQEITITVNDLNDVAPTITSGGAGTALPENTEVSATLLFTQRKGHMTLSHCLVTKVWPV